MVADESLHPVLVSAMPFPKLSWWGRVVSSGCVVVDRSERLPKMSDRNRYRIMGANNPNLLSIPIVKGRDQVLPIGEIEISPDLDWRKIHWRTIVSTYRRTPYFEYYEDGLKGLFAEPYSQLLDFNTMSIGFLLQSFKLPISIGLTNPIETPLRNIPDFRHTVRTRIVPSAAPEFPEYHQIFADRLGFQANLSALDLLFSEGPHSRAWLLRHSALLSLFPV